jgi:protein-S-isoprenylcysteine O-methyltransferase Ste14
MTALKTLLFSVLVPGTVAILIPRWLLASSVATEASGAGTLRLLGLIPMIVGAGFYIWCAWDFVATGKGTPAPIEPPKTLVARGLYRLVRNPMYVGVLLMIFGQSLFFESATVLGYGLLLCLIFHAFVIAYEEPTLRRMFGSSYDQYCKMVPRWVPRLGRISDSPR